MGIPLGFDLDLLRTFVAIAEERSFTWAAARVGRTQSAVSLRCSDSRVCSGKL